jgi:hypothetical protein
MPTREIFLAKADRTMVPVQSASPAVQPRDSPVPLSKKRTLTKDTPAMWQ